MKTKLQTIADNMRRPLAAAPTGCGWVRVALPGGLDIILERRHDAWRLALRRHYVDPSANEGEICASHFGVAQGSEPSRLTKTETLPATHEKITWHILEYRWIEREPASVSVRARPYSSMTTT